MLTSVDLKWPARSVGWHPSGLALAIGFHEAVKGGGGGKKKKKGGAVKAKAAKAVESGGADGGHEGAVHIYSFHRSHRVITLAKRAHGCDSLAWVCDVKFSVGDGGKTLGASAHDRFLYLYRYVLFQYVIVIWASILIMP